MSSSEAGRPEGPGSAGIVIPKRPGSIFTFYSYKGGVGRSLALAKTAIVLAKWGARVLCVDWDLEAPGLHLYAEPGLSQPPIRGLVELVHAHVANQHPDWTDYITEVGLQTKVDLMPAGAINSEYVQKVQALQ